LFTFLIAMTHPPETGAINRLHFSGAGFWHVCHANVGLDSSVTKFWRGLEHCSVPENGVHVTELMIYELLLFD